MLKEKLQAMVEQSTKKIPEAAKKIMSSATQSVADSISSRTLPKVGDRLPAFELADSKGQLHHSDRLLSENNLILTFFRGGW